METQGPGGLFRASPSLVSLVLLPMVGEQGAPKMNGSRAQL